MLTSASPHVALMGIPIDNLTMDQVLNRIEELIHHGGFHQIATANSDFLIQSAKDEELQEILCRCDIVVADGMPLVWASKLLGTPLKDRVTGADMVPLLAALSERKGYRIFMLGASESSSKGAEKWIQKNHPGAVICGRYCPPHKPLEEMDHEDILSRIEAAKPDILLVAFGNPKQEKWLAMHRGRLTVPVCIGVGGSFDFLAGNVRRAPVWMQRSGLEWLARTVQDPGRLVKRYAKNLMGLLSHLPVHVALNSAQGRGKGEGRFMMEQFSSTMVARMCGVMRAEELRFFERKARETVEGGYNLVVDMSKLDRLNADMIGSLICAMNDARIGRTEFWLAGMNLQHRTVLKAAGGFGVFRKAPTVQEALRRIEPGMPTHLDEANQWVFYHVGGRTLPVRTSEVGSLYLQVRASVGRLSR